MFFKQLLEMAFKDINEIVLIIDLRKRKLYQRNKTARNAKILELKSTISEMLKGKISITGRA